MRLVKLCVRYLVLCRKDDELVSRMIKISMLNKTAAMTVFGMAMLAGTAMASDAGAAPASGDNYLLGHIDADADQFITLTDENDKWGGNSDRHYTNGTALNYTVIKPQAPELIEKLGSALPFLDVGGPTALSFSFGQNMFTPDHAELVQPQIGDMPYSGFLYGKAGFTTYQQDHTDSYDLTAGVIGPAAGGKFAQRLLHDTLDLYKPNGWDYYHLKNEPILNFGYLRRYPGAMVWNTTALGRDWFADVEPRYGFAAGNAYDFANVGGTLRFGPSSAQHADTPAMLVPGLPGSAYFGKSPDWFTWYGFLSLDGRGVLRNIFLDGNTFESSPHVEKIPFVAQGTAGVVVETGPVKTSFTLNQSTKEFESQPHTDVFGAINVGYRF